MTLSEMLIAGIVGGLVAIVFWLLVGFVGFTIHQAYQEEGDAP